MMDHVGKGEDDHKVVFVRTFMVRMMRMGADNAIQDIVDLGIRFSTSTRQNLATIIM